MSGLRAFAGVLALVVGARAIGQTTCVYFDSSSSSDFAVVSNGQAAPIYHSSEDWGGVQLAATNFAADIERVTGVQPALYNVTTSSMPCVVQSNTYPIIIGTLGQSPLIDAIVNQTGLDVSSIEGQWEAFMTRVVSNPLPGVKSAYVMIGADKRGTIYAVYDHSEQFGVSPWYWWADVPTKQNSELYVAASGCAHGSPTVKYRGIFFNDEQPALQNWATEKFSNVTGAYYTGSPFNSMFYMKVFELMLRFKANYLWPGKRYMRTAFAVDDPSNQYWADFYGIVMGTSHEEPIMRSTPVEWNIFGSGPWDYSLNQQNIYDFWVVGAERGKLYENIYTVGMRGAGDVPMSTTTNVALLERVIADQRQILTDTFNGMDVATIPQMWCLYKEVLGYYEAGLQVPDDVTLMWTDDNYGNVERYPIYSERNRTGGAGVYYHVGDPRDYKWITSSQMAKTYDQMSLAIERGAVRIWVLNVGDLKPYEMQTEFFITYGWNATIWTPGNLNSFVYGWAKREFGLSNAESETITRIIANVTMYNSRRKPEMLNGTTYSLTNYREAEIMLQDWDTVLNASTAIYSNVSAYMQPAFFELVQHPVEASHTVATMWIYAGINSLRASQARLSANEYADKVQALFQKDYDLELEYHTILDGEIHRIFMMDQTHIMYYYWQQPMQNTMPFVTYVQSRKHNIAGGMRIVPEKSLGAWPGDNMNNCAQGYSCPNPTMTLDPYIPLQNRYIDVGAGGPLPFTFTVTTNVSWLDFSVTSGSVSPSAPEERVYVSVKDWSQVTGVEAAVVNFNATSSGQPMLNVPVTFIANHTVPASNFTGFVEGDGVISIEAAHTSSNTSISGVTWMELPGYGRTLSGITPLPRMGANGKNFTAGTGPSVTYDFYNFNTIGQAGNITITTYVAPSLNANGDDRPIAFAIQVDDEMAQTEYFIPYAAPGTLPAAWNGMDGFAATNIAPVRTNFIAPPGAHQLKIWMVEPAVVVEKIVIDTGGLVPSYLGPPESMMV
ncbi:glycoside hydrolase family 115 protein [Gyrodon lividus]|nr:glycoside hydrolase family 115 protein [Gyrodon lividus]